MSLNNEAKGLQLREATDDDLDVLADLNKQLMEDENHDEKANVVQLKERMRDFIHAQYKCFLFEIPPQIVGYCLVDVVQVPVYLKHFFICRNERLKGYGQLCFHQLLEKLDVSNIDIQVFSWNSRGIKFWKSLGFQERCISMRFSYKKKN